MRPTRCASRATSRRCRSRPRPSWSADQAANPPWGTALTEPLAHYTRYCQTSSTTGRPLRWIDTNESWQWMLECWKAVYRAARVGPGDRVFFPFSFGPFLGFWAGVRRGLADRRALRARAAACPASCGWRSSRPRARRSSAARPPTRCTWPRWRRPRAIRAARRAAVRVLIVAGEPGGSIPATRERIEQAWGARVIDHHGLTEVGPAQLRVLGGARLPAPERGPRSSARCSTRETLRPVPDGTPRRAGRDEPRPQREPGHSLSHGRRRGAPLRALRLRPHAGRGSRAASWRAPTTWSTCAASTSTRPRSRRWCAASRRSWSSAPPSRAATRCARCRVEIEPAPGPGRRRGARRAVGQRLREALGLTVPVRVVEPRALPRFEMKARRFVVEDEGR